MDLKHKEGLTLVEVLIASFLTTMLIAGIYAAITQSVKANHISAQHVAAFGLCKDTIEEMKGSEYSDIATTNFPTENVMITHLLGTEKKPLYGALSCNIDEITDPAGKMITVTVSWNFRGKSTQETVTTIIYKKQ